MTPLSPDSRGKTIARSRKPGSRIFQGICWSVSRPDFGFAEVCARPDVTKPLFEIALRGVPALPAGQHCIDRRRHMPVM
jgi:hypothetical protein